MTWWLWRAFLSRYRTVYRLPPIAHTPLLLSPPLSSSEGSVTFSRAITLPNDQGNASPFSAFCPLSSSLLEPCVCVRRARGRGTRRSKRSCLLPLVSSAPSFVSSASLSPHFRQSDHFVAPLRQNVGGCSVTRKPRTPPTAQQHQSRGESAADALPLSHPHERRRARPGAHDL